ncbi:ArnT family glycosyltransferase [Gardnerella greenwoodii]|uniref:ArnT family glycosyltransferase n=1 Tax=Gardnerella greenwoodii TaxID=2914925 RepID=UPI00397076E6
MVKCLQHISVTLGRFFSAAALWCAAVFFSALSLLNLVISAHLLPGDYTLEFLWFQAPFVIVISAAIFFIIALLRKRELINKLCVRYVAAAVFAYVFVAGLIWVHVTHAWPEWDPVYLFSAAQYYADPNRTPVVCGVDTSELSWIVCPGGYLTRFPFQFPLLSLMRFLVIVFGPNAYTAFEVLNVLCAAITGVLIAYYVNLLFRNKNVTILSLLFYAAFLPMIFYATFAYGNTLCLPFVFGALIFHAKNIRGGSWRDAMQSLICIFFAILLKSTMVYCLLGMIVVWIVSALRSKKWEHAVCVLLAIAFFALSNVTVADAANSFGHSAKDGLPSTVWLAMATDPARKGGPNNPGWYNGYPTSFDVASYNKETIKKESTEFLQNNLKHFANNPSDLFSFFTKKFAGEWLEPTYESLLASSWKWNGPYRQVLIDRKMNPALRSLYSGKLNMVVFTFLDALQFMLVAFTAVFLCVLLRKRKSPSSLPKISCEFSYEHLTPLLTPLVIVLGMAVLYIVWEAQSQYILPAYLLMIPFAARGFDMLLTCYENRAAHNSNAANPSQD